MQYKFECHLTFANLSQSDKSRVEHLGREYGFHFSEIDGDEILGPGSRSYLTRSDIDGKALETDMVNLRVFLQSVGLKPKREKIEMIVHDVRFS